MIFETITKKNSKLYMNFFGMSGCGKTYSALLFATILASKNEKILIIDTEDRASIYADDFPYIKIIVPEKIDIQTILSTIKEAKKQKFEVIIIDSLTLLWDGAEGLMTKAMAATDTRHGKNWQAPKQTINAFTQFLKKCGMHIITNSLAKEEVKNVKNTAGKEERVTTGNILPIFERAKFEPYLDIQLCLEKNGTIKKVEKGMHSDIIKEMEKVKQITKDFCLFVKNWISDGSENEPNEKDFLKAQEVIDNEIKKEEIEVKKEMIFDVIKDKNQAEFVLWFKEVATQEEIDIYKKNIDFFRQKRAEYKENQEEFDKIENEEKQSNTCDI